MSIDHSEVGKIIKSLREKRGWTQDEFGALVGISQSKMNKIETGYQKKYEPEVISKIADKLGVTTDFLFGRDINKLINNNEDKDEEEFLKWMNDPTTDLFFREYIESPDEMKEQLRKIWDIIKQQQK